MPVQETWAAYCALASLILLLWLIIRGQMQAFVALLVVSVVLGLATGMPPLRVVQALGQGVGDIAREVILVLALGAMLGRVLEASRAAEVLAQTLLRWFGETRASLAVLLAAYLVGLPVLFNVGFLLLISIVYQLQEKTGKSLLYYGTPMAFSLGVVHSLVPPHPGIVYAVSALQGNFVKVMVWGALLAWPMALVGWYGVGKYWAARQFVAVPAALRQTTMANVPPAVRSFGEALLLVVLPLLLSAMGFAVEILERTQALPSWTREPLYWPGTSWHTHSLTHWLRFFGHPIVALAMPIALGMALCWWRAGFGRVELAKLASKGLEDVGSIALLFLAAGAFKQILQESGAGQQLARWILALPLSPALLCYLVAVAMRIALGSATAAIVTAAPLLAPFAAKYPGQETLLILALACGITFMTQPADSGFWMVKEYFNLSVRDVMLYFNAGRIAMSVFGIAVVLIVEQLMF
ncbi:MAG: SLC13 family permease [Gemmatales bacterium]|nr:GntP family permease [Gemmatales bacterium]MDW7994026.1 SLC13 family permease [Gemmatales bacterium]